MKIKPEEYVCKKCKKTCGYSEEKYPYCYKCKRELDSKFYNFKLTDGCIGMTNRNKVEFRKLLRDDVKIVAWKESTVYGGVE